MKKLPLSTFKGHLRSINPEDLNELGKEAMRLGFPGFFSNETLAQAEERVRRDFGERNFDYVFIERNPPRRFAVETEAGSFPRGKYFTIARTPEGHDDYTLMNELRAYMEPESSGAFLVGDLATKESLRFLGITSSPTNALAVVFKVKKTGQNRMVVFPARCKQEEIKGCIDLRRPKTQSWFFDKFRTGDGLVLNKPNGTNASSFHDMLIGLMWPELGGGDRSGKGAFIRAIGVWMGLNKISALIYPSARSNPSVQVKGNKLINSTGWNLVDYRGTSLETHTLFVDMSPWPKSLPYQVVVQEEPANSPFKGSWKISGNKEGLDALFDNKLPE